MLFFLKKEINLPNKISLLRLDTDWYESTKQEMEVLFPKVEKDGVLLIDDYGLSMDPRTEIILRKKIVKMNNILGTTVLLSSSSDYFLKQFASVIIYLDNGHVSKIRKGFKKNFNNKKK